MKLAEREGFEPSVLFRYTRFPGARFKPLSHLSTEVGHNSKPNAVPRKWFSGAVAPRTAHGVLPYVA